MRNLETPVKEYLQKSGEGVLQKYLYKTRAYQKYGFGKSANYSTMEFNKR